jgi:3-oxoacyl-[acyl-carrier-protein] synthase III
VIEEALENAGLEVGQVDWLLLHQANIRIMDVVAERLGLSADKVMVPNQPSRRVQDNQC